VPTVAEYGEAQLPEPVPYATKPVDQAVSAPLRWTVAKPKRVLVDQYHSARFRLDDARPHGLRRLKQRLQQEGYEVLGWDKPVSTSVLHSVGVYIGLYPGNSVGAEAHGPEEVKALVEWTWYRHGRIVMLVQEGSGWGGSIRPIWAVSPSRLKGVGCDNEHGFRDQPHHLVFEAKDQSGPKSIWNGVTRIVMPEPRLGKGPPATRRIVRPYRSCFADVNGNGKLDEGEERVSPARICFAATHSEGNGRYAGVMSIRMFANGKEGQWGISVEDNARFFVNLVRHVQEPVPVYELPRELTMKRMEALVERARAKAEADKKKWDPIFERLKRQGRMGVPLSGP
jgi:hypothetical protein